MDSEKSTDLSAMSRRGFCRMAALALAAAAVPLKLTAAGRVPSGSCRVRVVRRNSFPDLQSAYLDDPDCGQCGLFADGQEFLVDRAAYAKFESGSGICPLAWRALKPYVDAAMEGSGGAGCSPMSPEAGVSALVSCPEAARAVVFSVGR